ncbi:MAG: hypothetical protein EXS03_06460 [Phycisphaerales bacterium]|nr:hypothetical protein [Phycisphaerales bacterium]
MNHPPITGAYGTTEDRMTRTHRTQSPRALTLVEILAVVGIIALLLAILLPALRVARANSAWAASQNNLRQIHTLMQAYVVDNRETVLPSQFDHTNVRYKGAMRSPVPSAPPIGLPLMGTWADILWTVNSLGSVQMPPDDSGTPNPYDYRYDSPDRFAYQDSPDLNGNFLRSTIDMETPFVSTEGTFSEATPFGPGASLLEIGHAGYFAANDFFDAQQGIYYTSGQIKRPSESVYLVDSRAGEIIDPLDSPWKGSDDLLCEVDFRYPGETCLFLCLDGHVQTEAMWADIEELQGQWWTSAAPPADPTGRGLRVSNLNRSDNPQP